MIRETNSPCLANEGCLLTLDISLNDICFLTLPIPDFNGFPPVGSSGIILCVRGRDRLGVVAEPPFAALSAVDELPEEVCTLIIVLLRDIVVVRGLYPLPLPLLLPPAFPAEEPCARFITADAEAGVLSDRSFRKLSLSLANFNSALSNSSSLMKDGAVPPFADVPVVVVAAYPPLPAPIVPEPTV